MRLKVLSAGPCLKFCCNNITNSSQIWVAFNYRHFFFLLPGLHIGCGLSRLWPEALRAFHFRIQAAEATLGECSSYPGEQHLKRGEQQLKKDEQKHTEPLTASVWMTSDHIWSRSIGQTRHMTSGMVDQGEKEYLLIINTIYCCPITGNTLLYSGYSFVDLALVFGEPTPYENLLLCCAEHNTFIISCHLYLGPLYRWVDCSLL